MIAITHHLQAEIWQVSTLDHSASSDLLVTFHLSGGKNLEF